MQRSRLNTTINWLRWTLIIAVLASSAVTIAPNVSYAQKAKERQNAVVSIFKRFKKDVSNARGLQRSPKTKKKRAVAVAPVVRSGKPIPVPRSRPQLVANNNSSFKKLAALAFQPTSPTKSKNVATRAAVAPVPKKARSVKPLIAAALVRPVLPKNENRQRSGASLILAKVSPAVRRSSCPKRQLIGLVGIRAPHEVKLSPQANVQRPVGLAAVKWMEQVVQPAARRYLGSKVVKLRVAASFACRTRNGIKGAKLSEHGYGNALDISVFTLENGKQVSVAKGWKGRRSERQFLRAINDGACGHFTTVLGPRADKFHQDHFHLDLARHGKSGTYKVCK